MKKHELGDPGTGLTEPKAGCDDDDDGGEAHTLTLDIDAFAWEALNTECAQLGTTIEALARFSILYYLADGDSGRIARRLPQLNPPGEPPPPDGSNPFGASSAPRIGGRITRPGLHAPTFAVEALGVDTSALAVGLYAEVEASDNESSGATVVDATSHRFRRSPTGPARAPRVSVVIPTLNEARNIPHVLAALPSCVHEVVIVDGRSTDGTPEVASQVRPDAKIVYQTKRGKGDALRCGFEAATGDILVMLDADGSADPQEIPAFVDALLAGADFAKGTRFGPGGGSADITRLRSFGNGVLSGTVNLLFRTSYSDLCYGYNAFWRHCLPAMSVDCAGFEVETLINIRIARAGLVITEVPSFEAERIHGQSNLRTFRDGGRVLRTIFRERLRWTPHCHDVDAANERFAAAVVEAGLAGTAAE
jgi:hypothetical protein